MVVRTRHIISLIIIGAALFSCIDDREKGSKYDRPEWLAGKVYTQLKDQPDLSTFARCVELAGYDTIIDRSGSYTVFAPNNEAFSLYFENHPEYSSIDDIPAQELRRIVKFHIVQNPWTKKQLRSLDVFGWIDTLDIDNDEPRGFKRETLLLEKDLKFGVKWEKDEMIIVDTLQSTWHRRVATDSRKYAPFFYQEYFNIYDLDPSDYEFYFNRSFESPGDIYFAGGRIVGDEIFAENGFVYNIDRVIEPLKNAYEILNEENGNHSYSDYLELVELFPDFIYNEEKTFDQPGAREGFDVDSLFDITFSELTFDITNEKTSPPSGTYGLPGNVTIRYHHGLLAPTNDAFNDFITEYLSGSASWGSLKQAPVHIRRIIVNTHMSNNPVYPTDFENGFYNGEGDIVTLNQGDIIQSQFGSNCSFIGLDKVIVPRAFKSVTGPVYLQRGYSKVMYAIERTGLLPALKREGENYSFFVESDANTTQDSSLLYNLATEQFSAVTKGTVIRETTLSTNDLRTLLLNHICVGVPAGLTRKEFLKNLAGNFIIINNVSNEVKGTTTTTDGYRGSIPVTVIPKQISVDADNGITYDIEDWFSFAATSLYLRLQASFPGFHNLLKKAGLSQDNLNRYTFVSDNEFYTVFAPTDEALSNSGADTLSIEELKKFLRFHFVQGDFIFTDGIQPSGYYETARVDEKSTAFSTVFTELYIDPGYDIIVLPDKNGGQYLAVNESSVTNMLTGRSVGEGGTSAFPNVINTAVVHGINKVFLMEELNTR